MLMAWFRENNLDQSIQDYIHKWDVLKRKKID